MKVATLGIVAALVGLLAVVVIGYFALVRPDPLAAARKSGDSTRVVRTAAVIETLADTGSRHNHNAVVSFGLRFTATDGRSFTARIDKPVPPLLLSQLAVGRRLLLEYDALDPAKVDLVEPLQPTGG